MGTTLVFHCDKCKRIETKAVTFGRDSSFYHACMTSNYSLDDLGTYLLCVNCKEQYDNAKLRADKIATAELNRDFWRDGKE